MTIRSAPSAIRVPALSAFSRTITSKNLQYSRTRFTRGHGTSRCPPLVLSTRLIFLQGFSKDSRITRKCGSTSEAMTAPKGAGLVLVKYAITFELRAASSWLRTDEPCAGLLVLGITRIIYQAERSFSISRKHGPFSDTKNRQHRARSNEFATP